MNWQKQEVIIRKMFKTEIRNDDTDKVYNASFQMVVMVGWKEKVTKAQGVNQEIWVDCLFRFPKIRIGHSRQYTSQSTGI